MLDRIRQETNTHARQARTRALRTVGGGIAVVTLAAIAQAMAGSAFVLGFGAAVLVAAGTLSTAALARWSERTRVATRVLEALDTAEAVRAIDAARTNTDRLVGRYRLAQNIGLVLGAIIVIGAAVLGLPFWDGVAAGAVLAVFAEQALDRDAEVRAERYASALA
jgi:hypothetical protein